MAIGLLVSVVVVSIFFYGVGFNLLFLWLASAIPIVMFVAGGPARVNQAIAGQPLLHLGCYVTLALLVLNHNVFSISYDSSFAATIIAAVLPLMMLVSKPEVIARVLRVAALIVFTFALISAYEFVVQGARAHTPLFDPNNYVTLLYLCWVPWILRRLPLPVTPWHLCVSGGISVVVCLAMLATTSRFALVVVWGMALLVLFLGWRFRWDWRNLAVAVASMLLGFVLFTIFDPEGISEAFDPQASVEQSSQLVRADEIERASAEDTRMLMLNATWDAIRVHGGLHGTGLFTFSLLYPQYRSELEQVTTAQFVHNDYIQLLLEGGVWLLIPMFVFIVSVGVRGFYWTFRTETFDVRLGYAVAVGIAVIHANVNFVFYVLPLVVLLGLLGAGVFRPDGDAQPNLDKLRLPEYVGRGVWLVTSLGLLYTSMLLLHDTFTYGVFSAQDHVPFARQVRQAPERMLEYAKFSQRVNANRGIPILGEARLREVAATQQTPTVDELRAIGRTYERAIVVDPWNPLAYTSYYQFLKRFRPDAVAQDSSLLDRALQLDPTNLQAVTLRIDHAVMSGNTEEGIQKVRDLMVWCEILSRKQAREFKNILSRLLGSKLLAMAEPELRHEVHACHTNPAFTDRDGREPTALMRWLRGDAD
ncbi:MAG: O-antigen ligase family protein [Pseudomonadota bacterium]